MVGILLACKKIVQTTSNLRTAQALCHFLALCTSVKGRVLVRTLCSLSFSDLAVRNSMSKRVREKNRNVNDFKNRITLLCTILRHIREDLYMFAVSKQPKGGSMTTAYVQAQLLEVYALPELCSISFFFCLLISLMNTLLLKGTRASKSQYFYSTHQWWT